MKVEKKPARGHVEFARVRVGETFVLAGGPCGWVYVRSEDVWVGTGDCLNVFCLDTNRAHRIEPGELVTPAPYKVVPDIEE